MGAKETPEVPFPCCPCQQWTPHDRAASLHQALSSKAAATLSEMSISCWILTTPGLDFLLAQHRLTELAVMMQFSHLLCPAWQPLVTRGHWSGASVAEKLNFTSYLMFIDLDVNSPLGCWRPPWLLSTAQLAPIPWKSPALLRPEVSPPAMWERFPPAPSSAILTLKAFGLSLSSVPNTTPTIPCYFSGLPMSRTHYFQKVHVSKKTHATVWRLISRSKGNFKGLMQMNMCAWDKTEQTAPSELFSIPTTWKGASTVKKTEISGMRPSE